MSPKAGLTVRARLHWDFELTLGLMGNSANRNKIPGSRRSTNNVIWVVSFIFNGVSDTTHPILGLGAQREIILYVLSECTVVSRQWSVFLLVLQPATTPSSFGLWRGHQPVAAIISQRQVEGRILQSFNGNPIQAEMCTIKPSR